ncbi:hypothetical protein [Xenorhabdus bovienii]|uniref:hypothetical protein n=1 Tax=Xenorhabdus bovienii TaxID=40576 RepID=UPI003DA4DE1B
MTFEEKKVIADAFMKEHGFTMPQSLLSGRHQFVVGSSALRLTDPCYSMDVWCAGTLENVKNGIWMSGIYTKVSAHDFVYDIVKLKERHDAVKFIEANKKTLSEIFASNSIENPFGDGGIRSLARILDTVEKIQSLEDREKADKLIDEIEKVSLEHFGFRGYESPEKTIEKLRAGEFYRRTSILFAVHAEHAHEPHFSDENIIETFKSGVVSSIYVGVDSGQAGMFDLEPFKTVASPITGKSPEYEEFYDKCCNWLCEESSINPTMVTLKGEDLPMGINSSSGYGDGGYNAHIVTDDSGQVIALAFDYMGDIGRNKEDIT